MEDKERNILDLDDKSDNLDGRGKGEKRSPSNSEDDQIPPRLSEKFFSKTWRKSSPPEKRAKTIYEDLLTLNEELLVSNFERFECPVCLDAFDVGEGVTLKECLHSACKGCLAGAVAHCEEPLVHCPYLDGDYACDACLQESEVKALVSPEMFERYLGRSVSLAECQAQDSFHCRTPDCPGWWLREGEGNTYNCPVCGQEEIGNKMEDKEITEMNGDNEKSANLDGCGKGEKRKRQSPSNSEDDQIPPRLSEKFFSKTWRKSSPPEKRAKTIYEDLLTLNEELLVSNFERFECPVCLDAFDVGEGVTLKECLHSACKGCLAGAVAHCEEPLVQCPYLDGDYTCDGCLQESEVKALVSPEMFVRYQCRSVSLAECQAQDSFHCRTPDCPGWWLKEGEGNTYNCPVCGQENCVTCSALHRGLSCEQWRMGVSAATAEARKNSAYVEAELQKRTAMLCPKCQAVITKVDGCDWMLCSACKTEICWATRGPRWGPKGRGDTSGGCGCTKEKKCHTNCQNCH